MMSKKDRADRRLKDHARKLRPFWEELEKLGESTPDAASDPFKMPYTSEPELETDFKLTFDA